MSVSSANKTESANTPEGLFLGCAMKGIPSLLSPNEEVQGVALRMFSMNQSSWAALSEETSTLNEWRIGTMTSASPLTDDPLSPSLWCKLDRVVQGLFGSSLKGGPSRKVFCHRGEGFFWHLRSVWRGLYLRIALPSIDHRALSLHSRRPSTFVRAEVRSYAC